MTRPRLLLTAMLAVALCIANHSRAGEADEPPVLPVGLDAYRMWDRSSSTSCLRAFVVISLLSLRLYRRISSLLEMVD